MAARYATTSPLQDIQVDNRDTPFTSIMVESLYARPLTVGGRLRAQMKCRAIANHADTASIAELARLSRRMSTLLTSSSVRLPNRTKSLGLERERMKDSKKMCRESKVSNAPIPYISSYPIGMWLFSSSFSPLKDANTCRHS